VIRAQWPARITWRPAPRMKCPGRSRVLPLNTPDTAARRHASDSIKVDFQLENSTEKIHRKFGLLAPPSPLAGALPQSNLWTRSCEPGPFSESVQLQSGPGVFDFDLRARLAGLGSGWPAFRPQRPAARPTASDVSREYSIFIE
jgi:hypothetical protein